MLLRTTTTGIALVTLVLGLAQPVGAGASQSAPPPLSADQALPDLASAFGSGSFGRWIVDGFGLPAYRYDVDELAVRTAAAHRLEE